MKSIKKLIKRFSHDSEQVNDVAKYKSQYKELSDRYTMQRICVAINVPKVYKKSKKEINDIIALMLAKEIVKANAVQLRSSTSAGLFFNKETYYIYVAKELVKDVHINVASSVQVQPWTIQQFHQNKA